MKNNSNKVMISIPKEFLNKIDKFADENMMTRSELIRNSLRKYMNDPINRGKNDR